MQLTMQYDGNVNWDDSLIGSQYTVFGPLDGETGQLSELARFTVFELGGRQIEFCPMVSFDPEEAIGIGEMACQSVYRPGGKMVAFRRAVG